ncbi:putative N-acylneuraminate cytidylyltransferase protein [Marine Group I thaumarchaeote SCGC AAA799-B03]|uniref:Putative N-acylneuraminate cytidylyltransferase protein n=1 Tax=Marine Group I thaumarchaeote SCGC AAA799-B03 TaxID=1502289 RepID=A0A087S6M3_9ARCH|nr:putative N-acylneuraminate cytidylyltransferase protein [Marine Group I thaumarchaeote SCGC AAA799-B03]
MTNIAAIIPARGGSKGIKRKNLIDFCGKPLVKWSILQALNAKYVSSVWVSSDHKDILDLAKKAKSNIIKRPKHLSTDTATAESTWLHAINIIEENVGKVDLVVGLQPTSPLRESRDIDNAINQFKKTNCDSLFSCSNIGDFYIWQKRNNKFSSLNYDYKKRSRRQNFSNQYVENGSIYIFKPELLKKHNNRLAGKISISLMDFWKSFEIDSIADIELCETLMKHYILKSN